MNDLLLRLLPGEPNGFINIPNLFLDSFDLLLNILNLLSQTRLHIKLSATPKQPCQQAPGQRDDHIDGVDCDEEDNYDVDGRRLLDPRVQLIEFRKAAPDKLEYCWDLLRNRCVLSQLVDRQAANT